MIDAADIRPSLFSAFVFILMWLTLVPAAKYLATRFAGMIPDSLQALIGMA